MITVRYSAFIDLHYMLIPTQDSVEEPFLHILFCVILILSPLDFKYSIHLSDLKTVPSLIWSNQQTLYH